MTFPFNIGYAFFQCQRGHFGCVVREALWASEHAWRQLAGFQRRSSTLFFQQLGRERVGCNYLLHTFCTSSTGQGSCGSFKDRKPIGEFGCCEWWMAERTHWWMEKCLDCRTIYVCIYPSICLSIDLSMYVCIYVCNVCNVCDEWYGMVWYGVVWYGNVWYVGMVCRYGM
jgi:hypothetical protein